ncbi:hypothetical protein GALMADRAFT_157445 [Galerina marginata CBS 339.88]|uniref:Uncharacterized protein n=1 Tax=Galerina marginata (strain CBS 339.88) TaxID=685588 RepID=A0A067SVK5_GALM3|nr:hypothetical protein GALMADRAFT_157445 [Galerina marginata CBS 339.88]
MFDETDSAPYLPMKSIRSVTSIGTFCGWNVTRNADGLTRTYEHHIGACMFFSVFPTYSSVALTMQFLLQLFLVPQGELFGQIMFLSSLGVSWLFNAYLASVNTEVLQTRILINVLLNKPVIQTLQFSKWTALMAFATVYLDTQEPKMFLDGVIHDTRVWRIVKETIVEAIEQEEDPKKVLEDKPKKKNGLNEKEIGLLHDMIEQASIGYLAAKEFK